MQTRRSANFDGGTQKVQISRAGAGQSHRREMFAKNVAQLSLMTQENASHR